MGFAYGIELANRGFLLFFLMPFRIYFLFVFFFKYIDIGSKVCLIRRVIYN